MKESAGILLFRKARDGIEVLLVHPGGPFWAKKDLGAWSIPKGEFDDGEEAPDCALRELAEELGPAAPTLAIDSLIELGSVRQRGGKIVHAWAAEGDFDPTRLRSNTFAIEWPPRSGVRREIPEVDRAEWLPPEAAKEKINPSQAAFVDRLLARIDV